MRVKEESEKTGLKLSIQKTKIMASSPITSWQIEGEKLEAVKDFLFLGSKITVDGDCSHEIKRCLLRESSDKPRQYIKIRHITLRTKVHIVKAMIFPVVMYRCENWTIKKAEHWRIDAFQLWCWRRLLRVPWTLRRSSQSVLKKIRPEYSLEGLAETEASVLWPLDAKSWFTGKEPDTGKDWRQKEKGAAEKWWLDSITNILDMNLSKVWEVVEDRGAWHATICWGHNESVGHDLWLNNNKSFKELVHLI